MGKIPANVPFDELWGWIDFGGLQTQEANFDGTRISPLRSYLDRGQTWIAPKLGWSILKTKKICGPLDLETWLTLIPTAHLPSGYIFLKLQWKTTHLQFLDNENDDLQKMLETP